MCNTTDLATLRSKLRT